jgi:CRISPR-associated protein Cas6
MFWQEERDSEESFIVPTDVCDLVFRISGKSLNIDHAYALAEALRIHLGDEICSKIGVHHIRMAESGNGWIQADYPGAIMQLSRRTKLVIRLGREHIDAVKFICGKTLKLSDQQIAIGEAVERKFSTLGTLFARAVACDPDQPEELFLKDMADFLNSIDIRVLKMICGTCGSIKTDGKNIDTRSLLIADLKPEESVLLQQLGVGDYQLLGCGLFLPHKGIEAVYTAQQQD